MIVQCQANLLEIVHARRTPPRLAGRIDGRQQQADEDADDGDHHQQFHERKTTSLFFHLRPHRITGSFNVLVNAPGIPRMIAACGDDRSAAKTLFLERDH